MAASSYSAAVDPRLLKYDVFISFRGETRNSFTSHLYFALCQKHIKAYIDEVSLEKGDDIERALPMAIKQSAISIIVFSENYASSRWCLDELVDILKCKKEQDQIVLTIFYGIDPSHIRHQKGTYAAAFDKHQERFKDKMDKVEEWRQALTRAADLSGWDSRDMSESVLVQQVVEDVMRKLQSISSTSIDDLKGLLGIRRQLCDIESLLCFDSPNVRILGIWGMGGIGKTTLARVVFKCFSNRFEARCFLESVREQSQRKGLVELEKEVFSKLLGEKDPDVSNHFVNVRLSRTKALLVLDDVDNFEQLERLAGDRDRFGPGSKIIVTSRNKLKVDEEYKVEQLDSNDARKLFYLKAFGHESCRSGFEEISRWVVEYTKGHPLALKVLGASVFCFLESIEDWVKELEKLQRIPNDEIQVVLKRSYDALDAEEKGLFLDIACFFKGERRDFVEGMLEGKPIRGLVNKSLITIEDGRIHMHDLIQEMGRDIVLRSTQRSRLWIAKDVSDVLENNKGTEAIEGIYLPWIEGELHLRPNVFEEMCKLRFFSIYDASLYFHQPGKVKVYIDGDLKYLPNGLRYLHWQDYPGKSLPSNFKPQYLVELDMPYSKLEQLWDGVQELWSLKHINLHGSKLLTKIPDLSWAPKLESINLSCCESLIHIPSLNLNLQATMDESAYRHQWLRVDYSESKAERTPGCIILYCCLGLTTLPKVSGNIRQLVLRRTPVEELPSSIESLENLLLLDLRWCYNLKSLPKLPRNIEVLLFDYSGIEQIPSSSIECLCSLRKLSLYNCKSLSSLPSYINLKALEELHLRGTSIQELPSNIGMLYKLKKLDIRKCKNLQSLPASIGMLYKLKKLDIRNCENLRSLPASIGMLYKLKKLDIRKCKNLQSLPASIGMLYKLKKLDIRNCENLQSLPELPLFIESVNANNCLSLEKVSTLRSTLALGRWLDKYDSDWLDVYGSDFDSYSDGDGDGDGDQHSAIDQHIFHFRNFAREFSFLNCRKLGEDAINNIFREFLYKVFCTATTSPEVIHSEAQRVIRKLLVCYPTKEIPRWFNNQSEGSSITITLPPNWYNPKTFLGFVVSVVVVTDKVDCALVEDESDYANVGCGLCLRTNKDPFRDYVLVEETFIASWFDHIVMWYNYFDHSNANFEEYQEATIEFSCFSERVKRCGVRMLYLKDAVEESDDGTTANFESWRIDSDTDYATTDDDYQSCGSDDDYQSCGTDDEDQSSGC